MSKCRKTVTVLRRKDAKRAGVPPLHVCGGVGDEYKVSPGSESSEVVDFREGQGASSKVGLQDPNDDDLNRDPLGGAIR